MTPRIESIRKQIARIRQVAERRQRSGENARRVVQGLAVAMDGLLRSIFAEDLFPVSEHVTLVAVGGYGRRELCPYSDVDIMFLCDDLDRCGSIVEMVIRTLWDSGIDLGHSVRSPEECLKYMRDDDVTAATLLESHYLAGSEALMRRFRERSLNRYRKLHREQFASKKLEYLRQSLYGQGRTIFVTEPHIKDGMCCLRDVQHILWIERIRRQARDFDEIAQHGGFSSAEVRQLEAAYTFLLRVRCELHFLNQLRQDILEADSQVDVASNLGYVNDGEGRAVEKLMSDYYRHAIHVHNFARYYVETSSRGIRFLSQLRQRVFSSRISSYLSLLDGRLYLTEEPSFRAEELEERILQIFLIAQERDAGLSHSLREWVRRTVAGGAVDFARSEVVNRGFLSILAGGHNTGRILTLMHETRLLGRILPEFEKLTCLVNLDGHHQFTVDEHTLRTLRELDRIETDPEYPEPEFRRVLSVIPDKLPLRLALLLHDIGKSVTGSHDAKGTEAAVVICERLGLDEKTIETVEFLVYRHLAMFRFSERIDFTQESAISEFARLVRNRANLDMLYLLTYIDIHSVGPGIWTAWKGAQLSELYQMTCIHLEKGGLPASDVESALAESGIEGERRDEILEHCRLLESPAYERETIPERMLAHMEMIRIFRREKTIQVHCEAMVGCHQITFCEWDRPHLFADLAGVLLSEGLNILGARVNSRSDRIALDVFQVVIADNLRVNMARRVENLRRKLGRIEAGVAQIADLISDRARRYRFKQPRKSLFPPRVLIDDDLLDDCTVIEVDAGDRPGLLYDLATAIADLGLDLRTAKVSTMIDRARDVFHVVESSGEKVGDPARRREIEQSLVRAAGAGEATAPDAVTLESAASQGSPDHSKEDGT